MDSMDERQYPFLSICTLVTGGAAPCISWQVDPNFSYAYTLLGHEYMTNEEYVKVRRLDDLWLSVDHLLTLSVLDVALIYICCL